MKDLDNNFGYIFCSTSVIYVPLQNISTNKLHWRRSFDATSWQRNRNNWNLLELKCALNPVRSDFEAFTKLKVKNKKNSAENHIKWLFTLSKAPVLQELAP